MKGAPMPPFDASRLERVRKLEPHYRVVKE
jgi:hypothetical protein